MLLLISLSLSTVQREVATYVNHCLDFINDETMTAANTYIYNEKQHSTAVLF